MAPYVNKDPMVAVSAFLKQVRKTGLDYSETIKQELQDGTRLSATKTFKQTYEIKFTRDTLKTVATDVFEAGIKKGKPKHMRSSIQSPAGLINFSPNRSGIFSFGSGISGISVLCRDALSGKYTSEITGYLNGDATKVKSLERFTATPSLFDRGSFVDRMSATVTDLKKAIDAVINNEPLQ